MSPRPRKQYRRLCMVRTCTTPAQNGRKFLGCCKKHHKDPKRFASFRTSNTSGFHHDEDTSSEEETDFVSHAGTDDTFQWDISAEYGDDDIFSEMDTIHPMFSTGTIDDENEAYAISQNEDGIMSLDNAAVNKDPDDLSFVFERECDGFK